MNAKLCTISSSRHGYSLRRKTGVLRDAYPFKLDTTVSNRIPLSEYRSNLTHPQTGCRFLHKVIISRDLENMDRPIVSVSGRRCVNLRMPPLTLGRKFCRLSPVERDTTCRSLWPLLFAVAGEFTGFE